MTSQKVFNLAYQGQRLVGNLGLPHGIAGNRLGAMLGIVGLDATLGIAGGCLGVVLGALGAIGCLGFAGGCRGLLGIGRLGISISFNHNGQLIYVEYHQSNYPVAIHG